MLARIKSIVLFACFLLIHVTQTQTTSKTYESTDLIQTTESTTNVQTSLEIKTETLLTEFPVSPSTTQYETITTTESSGFLEKSIGHFTENNSFEESRNDKFLLRFKELNLEVENDLSSQSSEVQNNPCDKCKQTTEINNLKHKIINGTVKISWDPIDEEEPSCQYKYRTKMNNEFFPFKNFTGMDISTRGLCGSHAVKIRAENNCHNFAEHILTIDILADPFEISVIETKVTDAQIKVATNCSSNLSKLNVECDSGYNKSFTSLHDGVVFDIDGLEAYTNYSCHGLLFKKDELVGNRSFILETEQTAPSKIRNLKILNITDSSFIIEWEKPENVGGILTEYEIIVHGSALYDSPQFCPVTQYFKKSNETINLESLKLAQLFQDLQGNFEYNITVRAKTIEYGPSTTTYATTLTPLPNEVENSTFSINDSIPNKAKATLTWLYPCKTYAPENRILFSIHIAENSIITRRYNETVKTATPENLSFDLELRPSTNYTIMLYTINLDTSRTSTAKSMQFRSPAGVTRAPSNLLITANSWDVVVQWVKPEILFGDLQHYQIIITSLGPLHDLNCDETFSVNITKETNDSILELNEFVKPHRRYSIQISAVTTAMVGDFLQQEFTTKPFGSHPPKHLICDVKHTDVFIQYEPPCDTNGLFDHYLITLTDEQGATVLEIPEKNISKTIDGLKYEMAYKASVVVVTEGNLTSVADYCKFHTLAGIPTAPKLSEGQVIAKVCDKQIDVLLRDDYFENENGVVKYFALLVGIASKWSNVEDGGYWNGTNWPNHEFWNEEGMPYQATPENWEPLKGEIKTFTFKLGTDNCTGVVDKFCNGPLLPNTEYYLAIRGYTMGGYKISNKLSFATEDLEKTKHVVLIVGISAGVLIIMILAGSGCVYWKRRPNKPTSLDEANQIVHATEHHELMFPSTVKVEEFPAYYNERKIHLSDEFEALAIIGVDIKRSVGGLPDNRKKNRYINILPYDSSRVPLDCSKNDYINASYIKGYSGEVEYIATQGPLESTVADFWMMVMNENCTVVAMVAQFEEQKKTKCHRYFPECREQMELYLDDGGEMQVRCSYALNYDYYIERQILVQANDRQLAVTHLQFLNWPDFGCPEGTTNMLQFTKRLRRHMEKNDSKAVVHCSAGVGRTGTLVAVDMLLQTIRDGKMINIYGIVAELRHQRTKMVQAESQYLYIYQCILDEILQPMELTEIKPIDPIYENMENLIEMKVLSKQNNNCDTQIEYFIEINPSIEEKEAESDKSLDDEQNKINNQKNEESISISNHIEEEQ